MKSKDCVASTSFVFTDRGTIYKISTGVLRYFPRVVINLTDKVTEKLFQYPISESGGPFFLWYMLTLITSTSEAASKALLGRLLETFKSTQLQEEILYN